MGWWRTWWEWVSMISLEVRWSTLLVDGEALAGVILCRATNGKYVMESCDKPRGKCAFGRWSGYFMLWYLGWFGFNGGSCFLPIRLLFPMFWYSFAWRCVAVRGAILCWKYRFKRLDLGLWSEWLLAGLVGNHCWCWRQSLQPLLYLD